MRITIARPNRGLVHSAARAVAPAGKPTRRNKPRFVSVACVLTYVSCLPALTIQAEDRESHEIRRFHAQIAPLLARHCLECHDSSSKKGGLDLSRPVAVTKGGDSGEGIVPGKADDSLLWELVQGDDMPADRPPLADRDKDLLRQWIDSGAVWPVDVIDPAVYAQPQQVGNIWVQRLTVPEYIETVRSTVGVDIAEEARTHLPPDLRADGFRNTAYNLNVDLQHVRAYAQLAEIIVSRMDVDEFISRFTDKRSWEDKGMTKLVGEMGKWLLRGPLGEQEILVFRGIASTVAAAGGDYEEAIGQIIEAMLQSPTTA